MFFLRRVRTIRGILDLHPDIYSKQWKSKFVRGILWHHGMMAHIIGNHHATANNQMQPILCGFNEFSQGP